MSEEKKSCYTCRLLKNVFIFSFGLLVGVLVGYYFAIG